MPPSWEELSAALVGVPSEDDNGDVDAALDPEEPVYRTDRPTLFRERHGWCPYSERVWLTLEVLHVPYDTVRIDNTGPGQQPPYWNHYGTTTPQMRWEDGRVQGESMDLVRALDVRYGGGEALLLYAPPDVEEKIAAWREIFPRRARPSSRAAFLFGGGGPLPKAEFERVLRDTNALLGDGAGPFFCGPTLSAADIAWAPFLERYAAQLPCLHDDLQVEDEHRYPHLRRWYRAMDEQVPAYACRVKGDASSWRKVLGMAGFGNMGNVPDDVLTRMELEADRTAVLSTAESQRQQELWDAYRAGRTHLAQSPAAEAAATIVRNREAIVRDAARRCNTDHTWRSKLPPTTEATDAALRGLASSLLDERNDNNSEVAGDNNDDYVGVLASFLDERMCVPRDMGALSAAAVKRCRHRLAA